MKQRSKQRTIGKVATVGLAVLFQVLWVILVVVVLGRKYPFVATIMHVTAVFVILWMVSKDINPAFKLAWTILILSAPVAGTVIYFLFGRSWMGQEMQTRLGEIDDEMKTNLSEDSSVRERLASEDKSVERQSRYIKENAGYPVYQRSKTEYFRVGEELYDTLIGELKKAERFIFMEYFIIGDGEMWQGILNVLEDKARMGLDVRLIYDDFGCAGSVPEEFEISLQRRGIRCEVFNPLVPIASVLMNHRDHRKITVIDGSIAFTGGINLADEYINRIERFGYWKDTGIMIRGEAVWSFTVMFLQMWSVLARETVDYSAFRPLSWDALNFEDDGYVQPYNDTPLDHETVGESVYMNIINRARDYVYIFTPYLITDNEMIRALCLAAKSGVDVRIVTPGIPDKKMVYLLTRSYYDTLIQAGVRIFEYLPGFLHAKSFVCDDEIATVGTINLDYRSLYLHFECGVWMYRSKAVLQIKEDAIAIFQDCREITLEDCQNKGTFTRIGQSVLRLFAPLL